MLSVFDGKESTLLIERKVHAGRGSLTLTLPLTPTPTPNPYP